MESLVSRPGFEVDVNESTSLTFLGIPQVSPELASVCLIPVPMEATVSYGGGTAHGPQAILTASAQLELYDREFDCEAAFVYGIHTRPSLVLSQDPKSALQEISAVVCEQYREKTLLGVLGGEHSLTFAVVRGLLARRKAPLTVVQLDAHADLRDSYEESPFSHACVARRLLELDQVEQLLQLGVRSLCPEEMQVIKTDTRVRTWFAEDIHETDFETELRARVRGRDIYLTVDVDGFDPTLIPSTGTPEPDGLSYRQGERILRILAQEANLVAFDCVELAPVAGHHASDFVIAKLVYRLMNLFLKDKLKHPKNTEEQS